jgi:hypothetical protein
MQQTKQTGIFSMKNHIDIDGAICEEYSVVVDCSGASVVKLYETLKGTLIRPKRGRPKMMEKFFYDPNEEWTSTITIGNIQPSDKVQFYYMDQEGNLREPPRGRGRPRMEETFFYNPDDEDYWFGDGHIDIPVRVRVRDDNGTPIKQFKRTI